MHRILILKPGLLRHWWGCCCCCCCYKMVVHHSSHRYGFAHSHGFSAFSHRELHALVKSQHCLQGRSHEHLQGGISFGIGAFNLVGLLFANVLFFFLPLLRLTAATWPIGFCLFPDALPVPSEDPQSLGICRLLRGQGVPRSFSLPCVWPGSGGAVASWRDGKREPDVMFSSWTVSWL